MKVIFKDGQEKLLSNEWEAARLIFLSRKLGNDVGYRVRVDESRPVEEQKKKAMKIQGYVQYLEAKDR